MEARCFLEVTVKKILLLAFLTVLAWPTLSRAGCDRSAHPTQYIVNCTCSSFQTWRLVCRTGYGGCNVWATTKDTCFDGWPQIQAGGCTSSAVAHTAPDLIPSKDVWIKTSHACAEYHGPSLNEWLKTNNGLPRKTSASLQRSTQAGL
jgi:hypothetical protein